MKWREIVLYALNALVWVCGAYAWLAGNIYNELGQAALCGLGAVAALYDAWFLWAEYLRQPKKEEKQDDGTGTNDAGRV